MTDNDISKIINELVRDVQNKRPWGLRFLANLVDGFHCPRDWIDEHVTDVILSGIGEYDLVDSKRNRPFEEFYNDGAILAFAQDQKALKDSPTTATALFELLHLAIVDANVKRVQISVVMILSHHLYFLGLNKITEHNLKSVMEAYRIYKTDAVIEDEQIVQYKFSDFIESVVSRNPQALLTLFMEYVGTHDVLTPEFDILVTRALSFFKKAVYADNDPVNEFIESKEAIALAHACHELSDEEDCVATMSMSQLLGLFREVDNDCFQTQLDGLMDLVGYIDSYRQDNYGDISPLASVLLNWEMVQNSQFRLMRRKTQEVPISH